MTNQELQADVDKQLEELQRLRNYEGTDEIVCLDQMKTTIDAQRYTNHFSVGIPTLDSLLNGFVGGELIIVSGLTKNGKTSFCQSITTSLSKKNINSLWFSFEMSYRQLVQGFQDENGLNIFVPATLKNSTMLWIKSKILEAILKYDVKCVFIDHLGFIQDLANKQDRRLEIDTLVREIKTLALELDIVIFLIHHIRKIESGSIPTFDDLKESSAIAQDSDKVLMIWRDFTKSRRGEIEMTGLTKLSIELDRREGIYKRVITLKYNNKQFTEVDGFGIANAYVEQKDDTNQISF